MANKNFSEGFNFDDFINSKEGSKTISNLVRIQHFKGDITKTLGGKKFSKKHTIFFPDTWSDDAVRNFVKTMQSGIKHYHFKAEFGEIETFNNKDNMPVKKIVLKTSIEDGTAVIALFWTLMERADEEFAKSGGFVRSQKIASLSFNFTDVNSADDYDLGKAGLFGYFIVSDLDARPNPKTGYLPPYNPNVLFAMHNLPKGLKVNPIKYRRNEAPNERTFMTTFTPDSKSGITKEFGFKNSLTIVAFDLLGFKDGKEDVQKFDNDGNPVLDKKGNPVYETVDAKIPEFGFCVWDIVGRKGKDGKIDYKKEDRINGVENNHLEWVLEHAIGTAYGKLSENVDINPVCYRLEEAVARCADINNPPTEEERSYDGSFLFSKPKIGENSIGSILESRGESLEDDEEEESTTVESSGEEVTAEDVSEEAAVVEVGSLTDDTEAESEIAEEAAESEDERSEGVEIDAE